MINRIIKFFVIFFVLFPISGSYGAKQKYLVEKFLINNQLKEKIMMSPLKMGIKSHDGREFVAYLYAENVVTEKVENISCRTGNEWSSMSKTGNYYIYLYDILDKSFSYYRTKIFPDFDGDVMFNVEGAHLILLPGIKHIKPDVFIISQFGVCNRNFHEAYSFSKNNKYLENYKFVDNKHDFIQLSGLVFKKPDNDKLHYSVIYNGENSYNKSMYMYLSEKDGKIHVESD